MCVCFAARARPINTRVMHPINAKETDPGCTINALPRGSGTFSEVLFFMFRDYLDLSSIPAVDLAAAAVPLTWVQVLRFSATVRPVRPTERRQSGGSLSNGVKKRRTIIITQY